MVSPDPIIAAILLIVGVGLLVFELAHPGALLIIPGSVILTGGLLYLFLPALLLDSPVGPLTVVAVAMLSIPVQVMYYRRIGPTHRPMSTTAAGLEGEVAIVISPIVPDTLRGKVRIKSEVWSARGDTAIPAGTKVRVVSGEGVSVHVVPVAEASSR